MDASHFASSQPASFQNHIRNIAVVGATGSVGKHITASLLKTGKHTVTAITRADSKSQLPDGVRAAKVDYEDQNSLVDALKGQQALVITMNAMAVKTTVGKLIEAAATAGVEWIMPNEYAPDVIGRPDMGKESLLLDNVVMQHDAIEKPGVSSWVGLTSSFWYTYSLQSPYAFGFDINHKKVTLFDEGNTAINTSTFEQCGRAVAALFSLPILPQDEKDDKPCLSMWRNKEAYISSFCISQRDMLASFLRVTGDSESDWTITMQSTEERYKQGKEMMAAGGKEVLPGFQQCMYSRVFYKDGCGDYRGKLENEKLGLPEESLDAATRQAVEMARKGSSSQ